MLHRSGRRGPIAIAAAAGVLLFGMSAAPAQALTTHTVASPDGQVELTVIEQSDGSLTYGVTAGTTTIFEQSPLGIATSSTDFTNGLSLVDSSSRTIDETYSLPAGTDPNYRDHANELVLEYEKGGAALELVLRAYDDGVAYRYRLSGTGPATITGEVSGFRLPAGTGGWAAPWNGNYEQDYLYRDAATLDSGDGFTMPMLASIDNNAYFTLITEANVYNANASYAPAMLEGDTTGSGLLNVTRTPDQPFPITTEYPFQTPWRTAIVAEDLDVLYNSDLVQNLNPAAAETPDWVQPGRAGWTWYSDEDSAADLDKQKRMVDFAASMGWEYVTVDCCYSPEVDLPEISQYAEQRGVKIFAWVTAEPFATPELAGPLAAEHKAYGVAGLKVDFFLNDSQEVQEWYQSIGDAAGDNELMLNLHGSTKPGGENRSWPWLVTSEAVAGTEHYKYPPPTTARLDTTLPFTRGPLGSMDYTPTMISQNDAILTQGHTLAQSIVFTSAMINYADSAAAYEQFAGRHLMRAVPAVWDESRVVEGFPGDHITVARRSGDDWFIGAMTDPARSASVPLDFLGAGTFTATIFSDDADGRVELATQQVTSGTTLSLPMVAAGGSSVHISKTPLDLVGQGDARYEAEDPSNIRSGGASVANCHGCSEGQKVGFLGQGGAVQFTDVHAPEAGDYRLTFSYTSGDPRDIRVSVNGTAQSTLSLPDSGGWEHLHSWSIDVPLQAGTNTVTFDNALAFGPDIDALTVSRTVEAEANGNVLSGTASTTPCSRCTGGQAVRGLDAGALDFVDQAVTEPGNHTVRIDYVSPVDGTVDVSIDGRGARTLTLHATGSRDAVASVTTGLSFGTSPGTITFSNATSADIGIDRVDVAS